MSSIRARASHVVGVVVFLAMFLAYVAVLVVGTLGSWLRARVSDRRSSRSSGTERPRVGSETAVERPDR